MGDPQAIWISPRATCPLWQSRLRGSHDRKINDALPARRQESVNPANSVRDGHPGATVHVWEKVKEMNNVPEDDLRLWKKR